MKKINLEEIYQNHFDGMHYDDITDRNIKNFALDFGKQLLELAAENADVEEFYKGKSERIDNRFYDDGNGYIAVNKQSILNTINDVE